MRKTRDRIRHSVLFELIGLITVTPLGGWVFGVPISHFGVVAVVSTTLAMGWNYVYNLGFDHAMLRLSGSVTKSLRVRIVHAGLFELGLLCLLVPFIAWYLAVPLWQAFVMDVSLAGFYVLYAFAFNWVYDIVFPVPEGEIAA
jgi:uncharacterized membrane protein